MGILQLKGYHLLLVILEVWECDGGGGKTTPKELSDSEERLVSSVAGPPPLQLQPLSQGSKRNSPARRPAAPGPSLSGTSVRAAEGGMPP